MESTQPSIEEYLEAYSEDYFADLCTWTFDEFREASPEAYCSLSFGAAGVAYAYWLAARVMEQEDLLQGAEHWIRHALRRAAGKNAFSYTVPGHETLPASAFLYGRGGMLFVRILVAHSVGEKKALSYHLRSFRRLSKGSSTVGPELYNGTAGWLAAAANLLRELEDSTLLPMGEELYSQLWVQLQPRKTWPDAWEWPGAPGLGLAHGSAGILLAMLLWLQATEGTVPQEIATQIATVIEAALKDPPGRVGMKELRHRLCGGFSGHALLAAKAFELTAETRFLDLAKQVALLAVDTPSAYLDLCCGRAGPAFVSLALARIDPSAPWRDQARTLAVSALLQERPDWECAGLFSGEAAIPCLALAITQGQGLGAPLLDLIPAP